MFYLKKLLQIRLLNRLIGQTGLLKRSDQTKNKAYDKLIGQT